jgi:hypothetical protein
MLEMVPATYSLVKPLLYLLQMVQFKVETLLATALTHFFFFFFFIIFFFFFFFFLVSEASEYN